MTIQEFTEMALEGGWNAPGLKSTIRYHEEKGEMEEAFRFNRMALAAIVLDPSVWQAVGKVKGWGEGDLFPFYAEEYGQVRMPRYLYRMHRMIDALAEGQTIEQYLETL